MQIFPACMHMRSQLKPPVLRITPNMSSQFFNCPVLWKSKLQTETALLTMEAYIVDLAHNYREFFRYEYG